MWIWIPFGILDLGLVRNIVPEISAEKYLIMDLVCNIWTLCVMLRIVLPFFELKYVEQLESMIMTLNLRTTVGLTNQKNRATRFRIP